MAETVLSADSEFLRVYLVTDHVQSAATGRSVVDTVQMAVRGGVSCVQVRMKGASVREVVRELGQVSSVLPPTVPLIVNDSVDAFLEARSTGIPVAGVHVGVGDGDPVTVRERIGHDAILGVSVRCVEQVRVLQSQPNLVDYFGVGPVFDTSSKLDAPNGMGVTQFGRVAQASHLPVVAIGGITAANAPSLRANGAAGIAVVSAVCSAQDPAGAAGALRRVWETSVEQMQS